MRAVSLCFLVLLAAAALPATASAADLSLRVRPRDGVVLGDEHRLTGALTSDGAPLAGQVVTLQMRDGGGDYAPLAAATTGSKGEYRFDFMFDRNRSIRVLAQDAVTTGRVSVFPRARISVRTLRRNVVRITQRLTGPRTAVIRGRTRFYVGTRGARSGRFAAVAPVRRLHPGRYAARTDVRIPASFGGRFTYAACFGARAGTDMGDPGVRCPRVKFRY